MNQSVDEVIDAIKRSEAKEYFPSKLNRTARRFDKSLFLTKLKKVVSDNS